MEKSIIYLDLIVLSNMAINFIFLLFIQKVYQEKRNLFMIFLSSFLGGLLIIYAFYNYIYLKIMKLIGGVILVLLVTRNDHFSKKVIKISLFYTLNLSFIGVITSFRISEWYLLLCAIIVILILITFENYRKYHIFIRTCEYNVIIKSINNNVKIKGFMDTGNTSVYLGYPIIYISKELYYKYNLELISKKKYLINIESVNGISEVCGYLYHDLVIIINNKRYYKDVIIVLSDISIDCILNPQIML